MSRRPNIVERKDDHIRIAVLEDVESGSTLLDKVHLVHDSLPELDMSDIDTSVELFGKKLSMPLLIGALTGGTQLGYKVNSVLARVAEKFRIGICVGSQRVAIECRSPEVRKSFTVVKELAPSTLRIANIGAPQVAKLDEKTLYDWCVEAIDMIDADAIEIHVNPLQECLQLEGEPSFRGVLDKLRYLTRSLNKPVIVKEVGFGISRETAEKLAKCGIAGIEVAGLGGTNFVLVEMYRAHTLDAEQRQVYLTFSNFGIPTVLSICEVLEVFSGIIIASGGVRTGLDVAKVIAIGAHVAAMAKPFLERALEGLEAVEKFVTRLHRELKIALFLTGSKTIEDLRRKPVVFGQEIICWLTQRRLKKCLRRAGLET